MDQLYEDIIESLELKPSLEPAKRKENKELEPILNKIKNLLFEFSPNLHNFGLRWYQDAG